MSSCALTGWEGLKKWAKSGILGNLCVFPALRALTEKAGLWVDADPLFAPALLAWHGKLNEACADVPLPKPRSVLSLIALRFET